MAEINVPTTSKLLTHNSRPKINTPTLIKVYEVIELTGIQQNTVTLTAPCTPADHSGDSHWFGGCFGRQRPGVRSVSGGRRADVARISTVQLHEPVLRQCVGHRWVRVACDRREVAFSGLGPVSTYWGHTRYIL